MNTVNATNGRITTIRNLSILSRFLRLNFIRFIKFRNVQRFRLETHSAEWKTAWTTDLIKSAIKNNENCNYCKNILRVDRKTQWLLSLKQSKRTNGVAIMHSVKLHYCRWQSSALTSNEFLCFCTTLAWNTFLKIRTSLFIRGTCHMCSTPRTLSDVTGHGVTLDDVTLPTAANLHFCPLAQWNIVECTWSSNLGSSTTCIEINSGPTLAFVSVPWVFLPNAAVRF